MPGPHCLKVCLCWLLCLGSGLAVETDPPQADGDHVLALVERAEDLLAAERYDKALTAIREARLFAPDRPEVLDAYRRIVRLIQGRPRRPEHLPDEAEVDDELRRIEAGVAIDRIEMHVRHGNYDEALEACQLADALLQRTDAQDLEHLRARVQRLTAQVDQARQKQDLAAMRRARQRSQELARELVEERGRERRDVFAERMSEVVSLMQRGHTRLALNQARRLMSDHPHRPAAEGIFRKLLDRRHRERDLDISQRKHELDEEFRDYIHRGLIPIGFDGRPVYPEGWLLRHPVEAKGYTGRVELSKWKRDLLDRLGTRETIMFDGVASVEALEMVARRAGIQLIIDNSVRANDVPVSLNARDMRVDNIISWVTRMAGTKWRIYKQAVYVGDNPAEEPTLRIYDVSQLIYNPPVFEGPDMSGIDVGGDTGNVLGGGLFEGAVEDNALAPEDLVDLIRDTIAPEEWDRPEVDYGITVFQGSRLVVSASPFIHTLIHDFLRSRGQSFRSMVEVKAHWLRVRDDFFEEIGIQWRNANMVTAPNLGPSQGAYRQWGMAAAASQVINRLPGTAAEISPALAGQGLAVQLAYMGATELSAILTAIERKNRARLLEGIHLTTLSGVRANAMSATQIAFLAGYEVGTGGADDEPGLLGTTIGTLTVGRILDVTPYVSADNKYVTMNIQPYFATAEFGREDISTAQGPAAVDLPLMRIYNLGTRVIVPDKGSVLMGGLGEHLEQHMATRVPFLGTLPFLGRLFGQRGNYSQRAQDYLMVRVQIILLEEEEAFQ